MKSVREIQEWIAGAMVQFGDPSVPVTQIFAGYAKTVPELYEEVIVSWDAPEKMLLLGLGDEFVLPIPVDVAGPRANPETGELECFGIRQIAAGVWALSPSL